MSSMLSLNEVFSCIFDDDFGLSEDGSIDEEDNCSYFGKSRKYR